MALSPTVVNPAGRSRRRPRLAAITMVRDEAVMLPRWIEHYTRQCGGNPEALLVIDDNSSDGSTTDLPCPVLRIPPETKRRRFERSRMEMVSNLAAGLLAAYDAVVFSDADEFVLADPARYDTLEDFLAERGGHAYAAMALNVVHNPAVEPPLDPQRPILQQRSLAKFVPWMCKPSLKRTPAPWARASHALRAPFTIDSDLYMFHAKFADLDTLRTTADGRRTVSETLKRAQQSTWVLGGDAMVRLVRRTTRNVDLETVAPFSPPDRARLDRIVVRGDGLYHLRGWPQVKAMRRRAFVRVPERFRDAV